MLFSDGLFTTELYALAGLAVLGGVFVWVLLPETKGRTLLEIQVGMGICP